MVIADRVDKIDLLIIRWRKHKVDTSSRRFAGLNVRDCIIQIACKFGAIEIVANNRNAQFAVDQRCVHIQISVNFLTTYGIVRYTAIEID